MGEEKSSAGAGWTPGILAGSALTVQGLGGQVCVTGTQYANKGNNETKEGVISEWDSAGQLKNCQERADLRVGEWEKNQPGWRKAPRKKLVWKGWMQRHGILALLPNHAKVNL